MLNSIHLHFSLLTFCGVTCLTDFCTFVIFLYFLFSHNFPLHLVDHLKVIDHLQISHPKVVDLHQHLSEYHLSGIHLHLELQPCTHPGDF